MPRKPKAVHKPTLSSRCWAIDTAIHEGVIVQANIRGTMQTLVSIKGDTLGVTLLFRNEEGNTVIFSVSPEASIQLFVQVPRE